MRLGLLIFAAALCVPAVGAAKAGYTKGVANAALVAAAKATPLKLIDYGEDLCRNDRTVEGWLRELGGDEVERVVWTGGPCELVTDLSPMDSGSDWCAQAELKLKHPKNRKDRPMVEIFFDKPTRGVPSPAYAFRADMDDEGLIRFRREFEAVWEARFPAAKAVLECAGDEGE